MRHIPSKRAPIRQLLTFAACALAACFYESGVSIQDTSLPIRLLAGVGTGAVLVGGPQLTLGVFIGAWVGTWVGGAATQAALAPVGIGVAAAAQAGLVAALVRRAESAEGARTRSRGSTVVFVMAGLVACAPTALASAITPANLTTTPVIQLLNNWLADTLSVVCIAPLMMAFAAPKGSLWAHRRGTVAVPLLVGFLTVLALHAATNGWRANNAAQQFELRAETLTDAIHVAIAVAQEDVLSTATYLAAVDRRSAEGFDRFAGATVRGHPALRALEWIPHVQRSDLATFEREMRAERHPTFAVQERSNGALIPVSTRPSYYPVSFVTPLAGNESAVGFDVGSDPTRLRSLMQARDSGSVAASEQITLVQATGHTGVLVVAPVYAVFDPAPEDRAASIEGFALGVFDIDLLVTDALKDMETEGVALSLTDDAAARPMWTQNSEGAGVPVIHSLRIADRTWTLEARRTRQSIARDPQWAPLGVLGAGLVGMVLSASLLLVVTGHSAHVEIEIAQRTRELSAAQGALAESARRLAAVVDSAADGILTTNRAGEVETVNAAILGMFDRPRASLIGQPLHRLLRGTWLLNGGRHEVQGIRPDRADFPVEVVFLPTDASGDRYTGVLRDLTEAHQVERLKDELISTVSHELRTPLTSLHGSLRMLASGVMGPLGRDATELLQLAERNSTRLIGLVNDLLDLSRLQAGAMPLELRWASIEALNQNATAGVAGMATSALVHVRCAPSGPMKACLDVGRMEQVLANLLSNAIKFSPPNAQVLLRATATEHIVRFEVRDHGPGISMPDQARLFRRFGLLNGGQDRPVGGTGLGLAISKAIVEQHGGRIGVESRLGHGACFWAELPRGTQERSR